METREDLQHRNKFKMFLYFINSVLCSLFIWKGYFPEGHLLFAVAINIFWIVNFGAGIRKMGAIDAGEYDFLLEDEDDWEDLY